MTSPATRLAGILGYPIRHSLSPAMQNAAFAELGLPIVYVPFEVRPADLQKALAAIRILDFAGVNVTIPFKTAVVPYLDRMDPFAQAVGSVNTIVNRSGRLTGYNTDGAGFITDMDETGFSLRGKQAILVGAGGAGRAIAFALMRAGVKKLRIANRNEKKARDLARLLPRAEAVPWRSWKDLLHETDLLVNATSVGLAPREAPLAKAAEMHAGLFVYDVIYNRPTRLLREARAAGCRTRNGLGMLLHQGALAFKLWTGRKAPLKVMKKTLDGLKVGKL